MRIAALLVAALASAVAQPVLANAQTRLSRLLRTLEAESLRPIDPASAMLDLRETLTALAIDPRAKAEVDRCIAGRETDRLSVFIQRIAGCFDQGNLPGDQALHAELAIARTLVDQTGFAADTILGPEEMARLRGEGQPGLVGLAISAGPDSIVIQRALPGGTAIAAGIGQGWTVVAIDGQAFTPADLAKAAQALAGEIGSEVTLDLRDPSGVEQRIGLQRIAREAVIPVPVARRNGNVLEITVSEFVAGASEQVRALVLREQDEVARIVLDLRGNTGGLLDEAVLLADLFLSGGTIAEIRGRQGVQDVYRADREAIARRAELVVLVDGTTASGAELVAAALADNGRARVVGVPTFGSGTIRTLIMLDSDIAATFTTAEIVRANGAPLEGHPLVPPCLQYDAAAPADCQAVGQALPPD